MANDISNTNWSETDASNSVAPPNGWPEGQPPSSVNDCARMMMGALKRFWDRINGTATMSGGTTAFALSYTVNPTAYVTGETFRAICNASCTGASTLNIGALGALNIYKSSSAGPVVLISGDLQATEAYEFMYDAALNSAAGGFHVRGVSSSGGVTSIADATNGGLSFSGSTGAVTAKVAPADAVAKTAPTASDLIVIGDAASSNVVSKSTIAQVQAVAGWKGSLTAGTAVTLNPYAPATTSGAVAHGLGAKPDIIIAYFECITGELGYSAGDRVSLGQAAMSNGPMNGAMVNYDATNCTIVTANETNNPLFAAKAGGTVATNFITAANWKIVAIPYKLN